MHNQSTWEYELSYVQVNQFATPWSKAELVFLQRDTQVAGFCYTIVYCMCTNAGTVKPLRGLFLTWKRKAFYFQIRQDITFFVTEYQHF